MLAALATAAALSTASPAVAVPAFVAVPESAGEARIAVTLSEPPSEPLDVSWRTDRIVLIADAPSAVAGRDYVEASGTLRFAPGETRQEVAIRVLDDAVDDNGGMFSVLFGEPGSFPPTLTTVEIADDEPTPAASVADVRVPESAGEAVLPITTPAISLTGHAMYDWRAHGVSAAEGADYSSASGTVAIGSGKDRGEVRIPIADDALAEPDERFEVVLSPAKELPSAWGFRQGLVDDGRATVTIVDDDGADAVRTVATVTRVRGRVRLDGRRLGVPLELAAGSRIDARHGAARIAVARRGRTLAAATVSRGAVRLARPRMLELVSPRLRVTATRGLRIQGEHAVTRAATPTARWNLAETSRVTRVQVLRGAVRAGRALVRTGRTRRFR